MIGALLCAREAARRLATSRGGAEARSSSSPSAAARLGSPGEYVDYAASEGGGRLASLGLARELAADGVRVNAVRPGVIETDIHASVGHPIVAARFAPLIPARRPGRPDEIADAILWLSATRLVHDRRAARRHGWQVEPSVVRKATLP